jgi:hypothetical protein
VIYAYAIVERAVAQAPVGTRGLGGTALRVTLAEGLAAVFSRHRTLRARPSPEAMWTHERVVETLMERGAVLPMRFGTTLADEDALAAALADRRDELLASLERVRGRVELGVRAAQPAREPAVSDAARAHPASITGREYVLGKLRELRRAEHAAAALHEPLAGLAAEARQQRVRAPDEVLRAAYLVDRAAVGSFRAAVERLQAAHPDTAILCTGPWPPYSFVGATDAQATTTQAPR